VSARDFLTCFAKAGRISQS